MTEAGDESSEDEELLACCFVNINLDSKAKCACKPYEHRHTAQCSYRQSHALLVKYPKIGTSQGDRCFILRFNLHQSLNFPLRDFFK